MDDTQTMASAAPVYSRKTLVQWVSSEHRKTAVRRASSEILGITWSRDETRDIQVQQDVGETVPGWKQGPKAQPARNRGSRSLSICSVPARVAHGNIYSPWTSPHTCPREDKQGCVQALTDAIRASNCGFMAASTRIAHATKV